MEDFEKAQQYLKSAGPDGTSLYEHLSQVIVDVVQAKPADALRRFEELSVARKQGTGDVDVLKKVAPEPQEPVARAQLLDGIQRRQQLYRPAPEVDEDGEEIEPPEQAEVPDVVEQLALLEWAGVVFTDEEKYLLALSIQKLTTERELEQVRFFGKLRGTQRDYFVVEATLSGDWPEDPEFDDDDTSYKAKDGRRQESGGEYGANQFVYFACNTLASTASLAPLDNDGDNDVGAVAVDHAAAPSPWTQLPQVSPDMIIAARGMRRNLTGILSQTVYGLPRFPWGEAALLRTQIARIAAATTAAPTGMYTFDEDDDGPAPEVSLDDEYSPAAAALELATPEAWQHCRPSLLKEGRTAPYEDLDEEEIDEDDAAAMAAAAAAKEVVPRPLTSIAGDKSHLPLNWAVRVVGGGGDGVCATGMGVHGVAVARSLQWPGAVNVSKKGVTVHCYVGDGVKFSDRAYCPPLPPPVCNEYVYIASTNDDDDDDDVAPVPPGVDPLVEQTDPVPPEGWTEDVVDNDDDDDKADEDEEDEYDD